MSSMYAYCARQSSEEFSALETSCIAMSFLAGASRPVESAAVLVVAVGAGLAVVFAGLAAVLVGLGDTVAVAVAVETGVGVAE